MTLDIPNAFIQMPVEATDKDGDRYIMKIRGEMVRKCTQAGECV